MSIFWRLWTRAPRIRMSSDSCFSSTAVDMFCVLAKELVLGKSQHWGPPEGRQCHAPLVSVRGIFD